MDPETIKKNGGSSKNQTSRVGNLRNSHFILLSTCIMVAVFVVSNLQVFAQSNNDLIEIISLKIPDFIEFKIKNSENISNRELIRVFLVSGNNAVQAQKMEAAVKYIEGKGYYYTAETIFKFIGFDRKFKAKKIKFEIGEAIIIYDIKKSKWE